MQMLNTILNSDLTWTMKNLTNYYDKISKNNWTTWFKRVFANKWEINTSIGKTLLIFSIIIFSAVCAIIVITYLGVSAVVRWLGDD